VPRSFDAVIERALAKDPADRYPSAGDLGRAARAAAAGEQIAPALGSVARGPAAPAPETTLLAAETSSAPTEAVSAPPKTVAVVRSVRWPRRRILLAAAALVAVVAAAVVALVATSGHTASGPLRASEVAAAARSFARAYAGEDPDALAKLLTSDVQRVSPTGVERGRSAVIAEYRSQFAASGIQGYRLDNLKATPGWVGRASAHYTVSRAGGKGFGGTVVFGVRRVKGRPLIGLIATRT
jgi:Domain of unknown function (DUF4440)